MNCNFDFDPVSYAMGLKNGGGGGGGGGGGAVVKEKDVNFIDYDGTILYSYTADEFQRLGNLPANPTHNGLTAQGWNWALADAKTYVASYGKLWIGQMYITESGDTEIDIELLDGRLSPYFSLAVNGEVEISWGDGSTVDTVTGTSLTTQKNTRHNYLKAGEYTIGVHAVSGEYCLYATQIMFLLNNNGIYADNNYVYASAIRAVRIGNSTKLGTNSFYQCKGLESVTIPNNSVSSLYDYLFYSCRNLKSLTVPGGVTSIGASAVYNTGITNIALPRDVTSIGNGALGSCTELKRVTIPNSVTSVGSTLFYGDYCLESVVIPSSVANNGGMTFYNCNGLRSVEHFGGATSISYNEFRDCNSLVRAVIPDSVATIGQEAFINCGSLTNITIPSGVTSISSKAFYACSGLGCIRFEPSAPPVVNNSDAWITSPKGCYVLVPFSALAAYVDGTNYPSKSTYTYIGFATYTDGATLPTQDGTSTYTVTWYASKDDALNGTNAITEGNGAEIYCRYA